MTKTDAEQELRNIFGHPFFYDEQWSTIAAILRGERILLIEKTGYGKSLCYQFPATQFKGVTVVFSPLVALMRDQISYLQTKGIRAECINSEQDAKTNSEILRRAKNGEITILYIAPERMENPQWLETVRSLQLSMIVIDEAHCISVWGHDFRPAFKRIINLVKLLPKNFPILATTATATDRVARDILAQVGSDIKLVRGNLMRENFKLAVIHVGTENAKFAWLKEFLSVQKGTGLVYTGTRINTVLYASWLQAAGFNVVHYHAGLEADERKEIEQGFMKNAYHCVVSTNALGMGIDKPDIRFIIHTQMPSSLIHYYQEIGRAGRDGKASRIVLLYHPDDKELQIAFINTSRPAKKHYDRVIGVLREEPMNDRELMKAANLHLTQARVICADLLEQGIIRQVSYERSLKYELQFGKKSIDTSPFEELRLHKRRELQTMIQYAEAPSGGMDTLCSYLGDARVKGQFECIRRIYSSNHVLLSQVKDFLLSHFPVLEVEDGTSNLINGIAAAYYGFTNVGTLIHRSKYEGGGDFPKQLIELTIDAFYSRFGTNTFDAVMYVPPTESGDLVKHFAEAIARELHIPLLHSLKKSRQTQPQKVFQNFELKQENVKGAFTVERPESMKGKSILLIDDIDDSGATIQEIGRLLTKLGSVKIAPLVIAKTIGSVDADRRAKPSVAKHSIDENKTDGSRTQSPKASGRKPEEIPAQKIIDELKKWRNITAAKQDVPTYFVLQNPAIDQIAQYKPASLSELSLIRGVGEITLKRYGEKILAVLENCGLSIHTSSSTNVVTQEKRLQNKSLIDPPRYSQAGKPWTRDEEEKMKELFLNGVPQRAIAEQLHRSRGSIRSRLKHLGMI